MLHLAIGSGNDLLPGDKVFGKAPNERVANLGRPPTYQGFEQATLNFVGKGSGYPGSDYEEILHDAEDVAPALGRQPLPVRVGRERSAPARQGAGDPRVPGLPEAARCGRAGLERDTPTPAEMPGAWRVFSNTLGQATFPLLSWYQPVGLEGTGVNYRIPLPGGRIEGGVLRANVRNPGLTIEGSLDGQRWFTYRRPVRVGDSAWLRTKAPDGRLGPPPCTREPACRVTGIDRRWPACGSE